MAKENRKIILLSDIEVADEHYRFTQELAEIFREAGIDTATKEPGVFVSGAMTHQIVKAMHEKGYRLAIVDANGNDPQSATVTKKAYNIGDVIEAQDGWDQRYTGWVVGPRSPETGIVMLIEPASGALDGYKTWHEGQDHAKELREKGYANARQPSSDLKGNDELSAIYQEVVKAGHNGNAKLNTSDSEPFGRYWSGTTVFHPYVPGYWSGSPDRPDYRNKPSAYMQHFDKQFGGRRGGIYADGARARVRCVCDAPPKEERLTLKP